MIPGLDRLTAALSDRYRIERELGAGGMATVYLARDLKHERQVAIKVMRPEVSAELATDRFLQEIRTTANLQHPHIMPVFDSGSVSGPDGSGPCLYFVMPLIDGETLRDRLKREGPLPVDEAIRLVREVADALQYAHEAGILHRDLKPENVMLSRGHALLADFGIARATGPSGRERLTQTGMAVGTPSYMSPEQATGDQNLGPSSDVYGLAAVLYEMLTGEPPFTGATFEAILVKRFTQEAPRLRTRRPEVPEYCDAAIAQALRRDPATRFDSAAAFAAALTKVRDAAPRPTESSIAVMPFANLSTDAENGYFADGLTEEVITTLSKVGTLRVISRSTMMQFRDRAQSAVAVASELGVTHVLEGSVRKAGYRLRISASLVAADSNVSLWAERFDGVLADVFDMQDRVAAAVVSALNVVLTPDESRRLTERPVVSAEAYDLYLRAREGLNAFTSTGVQQALGFLEEAIARDPDNIFLLRGMARACWSAVNGGFSADRSLLQRALGYAERIETLDSTSPYVHEVRGLVAFSDGRIADTAVELRIAFEAVPTDVDVAYWYAASLLWTGHIDEAEALLREVRRLEPSHPLVLWGLVLAAQFRGEFDEALAQFAEAPTDSPQTVSRLLQGLVYVAAGRRVEALEVFDQQRGEPNDIFTDLSRFLLHSIREERELALGYLTTELRSVAGGDWEYAEWIAEGFALMGDPDEAARWLDQSVDLGMGCHDAFAYRNAAWRPWLAHPAVAGVFARLREQADRYSQLPVAPSVSAMVA